MRPLILVGKPDCSLCEEASQVVGRVAAEMGLAVERVEVGSDPALEKFRDRVPVVLWEGRPVANLRVREDLLRKRLATRGAGRVRPATPGPGLKRRR